MPKEQQLTGKAPVPKAKILIVEDEVLLAQSLAKQLKKLDYDVVDFVTSGEDAIAAAIEYDPDLIIMDIVIQGEIDGIEAASHIFKQYNIPSIFLTAYADDETIKRAEHSGSYGYILKPFRVPELDAVIRVALQKHHHQSEIIESLNVAEELGQQLQSELQKTAKRIKGRVTLEPDLQDALANRQFELYYQPIIDLSTHTIVGAEALLRWKHPIKGLIPPAIFIPIAERSNLITPMGNWVLETACLEAAKWQTLFPTPLKVSVNLSPAQLHQPDPCPELTTNSTNANIPREDPLISVIEQVLTSSKLPPHLLMLEITENALIKNKFSFIETIHKLKSLGVQLAIDDFGTGYSSLSYLQQFPFNVVKLDRSFVSNCFKNSTQGSIIIAIIQLAKSLNLNTVAEGIEAEEEAQFLLREGCSLAQGYLYSPPLPAQDFQQFLKQFRA